MSKYEEMIHTFAERNVLFPRMKSFCDYHTKLSVNNNIHYILSDNNAGILTYYTLSLYADDTVEFKRIENEFDGLYPKEPIESALAPVKSIPVWAFNTIKYEGDGDYTPTITKIATRDNILDIYISPSRDDFHEFVDIVFNSRAYSEYKYYIISIHNGCGYSISTQFTNNYILKDKQSDWHQRWYNGHKQQLVRVENPKEWLENYISQF